MKNMTPEALSTLKMVAQHMRGREIADELGVSEDSVKLYLRQIAAFFGTKGLGRYAAVQAAIRRGYLSEEEWMSRDEALQQQPDVIKETARTEGYILAIQAVQDRKSFRQWVGKNAVRIVEKNMNSRDQLVEYLRDYYASYQKDRQD